MTFKELKNKIKEEQKDLAQHIKNGKSGRKPKNRNDDNIGDFSELGWNKYEYRHKHIVYCQFFNNTPYALIEQPRDENKPRSHRLKEIKEIWEAEINNEALCNCA